MSETTYQPIRIFISGACAGLAEARDALSSHQDIELVGTASEPSKAGAKLASTGAQVILHALQRPDHVPQDEIAKIREHTSAPVILLVTRSTPSLLDESIANGINDVVLLPQMTDNLVFTVKKAYSLGQMVTGGASGGRRTGTSSRIITLFSPKGGTGKTTLAANLGAMFAKRLKKRTLLIDLDLQFGDVAIVLGIEPKSTILDMVMSHGELDPDKVGGYVTQHESGLHVLPAPMRPEDAELVTDDRLASLLTAAKMAYDIVLIDTPPNFNSTVLTALDRTDDLLMVASLDVPAVKSVKVCLQTLELLHYPLDRCHVLLNRAGTKVSLKTSDIEKVLGRRIRFGVPSNRIVPTSVNRGVPVVISDPKSDVSKAIQTICVDLLPKEMKVSQGDMAPVEKLSRKERKNLAKLEERALKNAGAHLEDVDEDDDHDESALSRKKRKARAAPSKKARAAKKDKKKDEDDEDFDLFSGGGGAGGIDLGAEAKEMLSEVGSTKSDGAVA